MFIDCTAARKRDTVVNMSAVQFLGSTGIRVFVSAARALKRENKKLVLCGVQPPIEKALRLSGFDTIVELFPSLDEGQGTDRRHLTSASKSALASLAISRSSQRVSAYCLLYEIFPRMQLERSGENVIVQGLPSHWYTMVAPSTA
jgi:hypothetical protein